MSTESMTPVERDVIRRVLGYTEEQMVAAERREQGRLAAKALAANGNLTPAAAAYAASIEFEPGCGPTATAERRDPFSNLTAGGRALAASIVLPK